MDLLKALEEKELSADQGWSTANRFCISDEPFSVQHDVPVDAWPQVNQSSTSYSLPNNASQQSKDNSKHLSVKESPQTWKHPKTAMEFPAYSCHNQSKPSGQVQYDAYGDEQSVTSQQFFSDFIQSDGTNCGMQQYDTSQSSSTCVNENDCSQNTLNQMDYLESQEAFIAFNEFSSSSPQCSSTGIGCLDYESNEPVFSQATRHSSQMGQNHVEGNSEQQSGSILFQQQQQSCQNTNQSPQDNPADNISIATGNVLNGRSGKTNTPQGNCTNTMITQPEQSLPGQQQNIRIPGNHTNNVQSYHGQNHNYQNQQLMYTQNEQNIHSQNQQERHQNSLQFQNQQTHLQQQAQLRHSLQQKTVTYPQQNTQAFQHHTQQDQQNLHRSQNMNSHPKQGQLPMTTTDGNSFINQNQNASESLPSTSRGKSSFTVAKSPQNITSNSKLETILRCGLGSKTSCESVGQNSHYFDGNKISSNSNVGLTEIHNIQQESAYSYTPVSNMPASHHFPRRNSVQQPFSQNCGYSSNDPNYGNPSSNYPQSRQVMLDDISENSQSPSCYKSTQYVQSGQSSAGAIQSSAMNESQKCANYGYHNQYTRHSKSDNFQLKYECQPRVIGNLKVIGGNLEKGMVYSIKSSSGIRVCAAWNGKTFEEIDESSVENPLSMHSGNRESMLGGGTRNNNRGRPLKGNATGMHMNSGDKPHGQIRHPGPRSKAPMLQPVNYHDDTEKGSQVLLPNGRIWQHISPLARRSLHPENEEMSAEGENNKDKNQMPDQEDTKPPRKRYTSTGEELLAVCRFCGYTSTDIEKCERCSRKLPPDVKLTTALKKQKPSGCNDPTIDKKTFYGKIINEQMMSYKSESRTQQSQIDPQIKVDSTAGLDVTSVGRIKGRPGRKTGFGKAKMVKTRTKKMKSMVPETVTISSDEEGDANSSCTPPANVSHCNTPTDFDLSQAKTYEDKAEDEFPLFSVEIPNRQLISRRARMEDEQGRLVKKSKGAADLMDDMEMPVSEQMQETLPTVQLDARSVRIGGLKLIPTENIIMTSEGIHFCLQCESTKEKYLIDITAYEIENCQGYLRHPLPLLFLLTTSACGMKLRKQLKKGKQEFFDPQSSDLKLKYIVIIINKIEDGDKHDIRLLFKHYSLRTKRKQEIFLDITSEESQLLLVKTTPQVNDNVKDLCNRALTAKEEEKDKPAPSPSTLSSIDDNSEDGCRSRSASPLRIGFSGTIEKLVTYPPPPASRGITITNEDLFCLNEGEFLNDVIIDFYLKYLYLEKLSEQDRKRIHIFSSFFYKCLTQKQPRNCLPEEVAKKSPAVRRHSRVKTWTRHADLFEKDFILIPINEHAHWFLAIICFPGLKDSEFHHFQPLVPAGSNRAVEQKHQNSEQRDISQSGFEGRTESEESGGFKEICGSPVDIQARLEGSEKSDYCLGLKQPCILILDSLAGPSRTSVIKILKEYMQVEWDSKKSEKRNLRDTLKGENVRVPQQTNYSDCGVYVLQYAESFLRDKIMDFSLPMKGLKTWFKDEEVLCKRDDIRELILDLAKRSQTDTNVSSS